MQQHEREIMVGALLDLTIDDFTVYLDAHEEMIQQAVESDPIGKMVYLWHHLQGKDEDSEQLYVQNIALCSDDTLTWIVEQVSGKNPLKV